MVPNFAKAIVRRYAMRTGRLGGMYVRLCRPGGEEYARFLAQHGGFVEIGERCSILTSTHFLDPAYTRIGNNVHFATATIIGHDGSAGMLEAKFGVPLDGTGKVDIRDNVFVGHQAIILPGVTIGPDAIVAAGAVVTQDVPPGAVVGGVPARVLTSVDNVFQRRLQETHERPWSKLIAQRCSFFDPTIESELRQARRRYFFPDKNDR